jgi:fido (protein-threonine AMPylation protein)
VTDGYVYPDGSQVLINLLGIRDREALQRAEYRWAAYNAAEALAYADRARTITSVTWRGIHRRLFGGVYDWAVAAAKAAERKEYGRYSTILDRALTAGQRCDPMGVFWPIR